MKTKFLLFFLILSSLFQIAFAQPFLRMPSIIGDHMVLQEKTQVRIWGWADPGSTVKVIPSWSEEVTAKVKYDTSWEVIIPTPVSSNQAHKIEIETSKKQKLVINDRLTLHGVELQ